jgi:hypothetical protein
MKTLGDRDSRQNAQDDEFRIELPRKRDGVRQRLQRRISKIRGK